MKVRVNDIVKLIVPDAYYGMGPIRQYDIGRVRSIDEDGIGCRVEFARHPCWHARMHELKVIDREKDEDNHDYGII